MKSSLAQILVVIAGGVAAAAFADESTATRSINLGYGGLNPMPHCKARTYTIEYEQMYSSTWSVLGRGNGVNYHYDDQQHLEDGRLRGVDIGARYYPAGSMRGFFFDTSLGLWHNEWTFMESQRTPSQWQGRGQFNALRLNFDLGGRFPIAGSGVSLMPHITFGHFFSSQTCEATAPPARAGTYCSMRAEPDSYLFAGIMLGLAF